LKKLVVNNSSSISNTIKIKATRKNLKEKPIREEPRGEKPHSKGLLLLKSR